MRFVLISDPDVQIKYLHLLISCHHFLINYSIILIKSQQAFSPAHFTGNKGSPSPQIQGTSNIYPCSSNIPRLSTNNPLNCSNKTLAPPPHPKTAHDVKSDKDSNITFTKLLQNYCCSTHCSITSTNFFATGINCLNDLLAIPICR